MTTLRLVENQERTASDAARPSPSPERLPPGRHGLPADVVKSHQQRRLTDAAAAALTEQGYGRLAVTRVIELAGTSSATFYQHYEDVWACLTHAYEIEASHIQGEIESACAIDTGDRRERARAGIGAGLEFLADEPEIARLLSSEPPPQVKSLVVARHRLTERLGSMLHLARDRDDSSPPALERRLVGAALGLVSTYVVGGEAECLPELEPALSEFLLAPL